MTSTTALGRAFENHSMKFLNYHLNMCVRRVGGAGDGGIDLRGWWYVPAAARRVVPLAPPERYGGVRGIFQRGEIQAGMEQPILPGWGRGSVDQFGVDGWRRDGLGAGGLSGGGGGGGGVGGEEDRTVGEVEGWRRIRVVAQCKAEGKPISTRAVREMEGVMAHFHGREMELGPHQYDGTGRRLDREPPATVAVLLSRSGFNVNATIRAWRSPSPIILVHLPGGSPLTPNERDDGVGEGGMGMRVVGCWWNPALSGLKGLLGGTMEMRREILKLRPGEEEKEARDQWRVWYQGKRMGRVGPSVEDALAGSGRQGGD